VADEELTTGDALAELREYLRLAASEEPLHRFAATRYTICRDTLLHSEMRSALPGFLQQCLTIYRFRDFIHLYTPRLTERTGFVDDAIRECESRFGLRPAFDVFGDHEF
jgi:hypothetical protein